MEIFNNGKSSSLTGESSRSLSSSTISYLQQSFKILKNNVEDCKGKNDTIVIIH